MSEANVPPPLPAAAAGVDPSADPNDRRYTLDEFVAATEQRDLGQGLFEMESPYLLEVNLNGRVNTKAGSMVAYTGAIKFNREGMMDQGLGNLLKKAVSGEGMSITYADGQGKLYLADMGKKISVLHLRGEGIVVNGNDVLAFEPTLQHKITMMRKITAMASGGLFNVRFDGHGMLAITSHYEPITLRVRPGQPVYTDPNATIAWSASLSPDLKTDISFRTFLGRSSGESIQMCFQGEGFVVIQPYEEVVVATTAG